MVGSMDNAAVEEASGQKTSSFGASSVSCSICLDLVTDNGDRSRATLQCGHEFHLDCIGSAFNMKGAMQCPNCQKVERGQWLFANGTTRSFSEVSMNDWTPYQDPHELGYSEMPFRVHWCPFGSFTRLDSPFESLRRGGSSFFSTIIPPSHERMQVPNGLYHQQHPSNNLTNLFTSINMRSFNTPRSSPPVTLATPQSDNSGGFYIFPSLGLVRNLHEAESHSRHYPGILFEMDLGWVSFHHAANGPNPSNRSVGSLWQRHW